MKCINPISKKSNKGSVYPCGGCLPCRINERRIWTHRIILESKLHSYNAFVTLTYSDDNLPEHGVSVTEHQWFMRELRSQWHHATGETIRFYMCGEYGDKTFRPHYHYVLFNFPPCVGSGPTIRNRTYIPCTCYPCTFLSKVWGKGHVYLGSLTVESAQYVAGYVTKKMTKKDDERLVRRSVDNETGEVVEHWWHPEFSRMSTRPGIAAAYADIIVEAYDGKEIPTALRHGNRHLPLGRYLSEKIKKKRGEESLTLNELYGRQMLSLLPDAKASPSIEQGLKAGSLAAAIKLVNSQSALQLEQRIKRKEKRL